MQRFWAWSSWSPPEGAGRAVSTRHTSTCRNATQPYRFVDFGADFRGRGAGPEPALRPLSRAGGPSSLVESQLAQEGPAVLRSDMAGDDPDEILRALAPAGPPFSRQPSRWARGRRQDAQSSRRRRPVPAAAVARACRSPSFAFDPATSGPCGWRCCPCGRRWSHGRRWSQQPALRPSQRSLRWRATPRQTPSAAADRRCSTPGSSKARRRRAPASRPCAPAPSPSVRRIAQAVVPQSTASCRPTRCRSPRRRVRRSRG